NSVNAARHALGILEKHYPPKDPKIVNALSALAVSLAYNGEFEEAEKTSRRVVEADRESGRVNTVEGVDHLESLGSALRLKEDFAGAIPVLREAADRMEKLKGEEEIGNCLNELSIALNRNGQY